MQLQRVMVFLWLEWSQTPLILCLIPSLESGVQGVGMGYGITGPDDQQACTMRHSQKLGRISTGVWGKYWEQVYRRSQSPGCGGHQREGSDSNQSFPIFLVSPNTYTHTHTHTHTHITHVDSTPSCTGIMEPCGPRICRVYAFKAKGVTENSCDLSGGWTTQPCHLPLVWYLRTPQPKPEVRVPGIY